MPRVYDQNGDPVYPEDVLNGEELDEYYEQRRNR